MLELCTAAKKKKEEKRKASRYFASRKPLLRKNSLLFLDLFVSINMIKIQHLQAKTLLYLYYFSGFILATFYIFFSPTNPKKGFDDLCSAININPLLTHHHQTIKITSEIASAPCVARCFIMMNSCLFSSEPT